MAWSNRLGFRDSMRRGLLLAIPAALLIGPGLPDPDTLVETGVARANPVWSSDLDRDGLPDEIELVFGTQPLIADSDGDSHNDAVEWTLRSDPLDPASIPTIQVALRSYAYETTQNTVRVFTMLFPGNVNLIDNFMVFLGSPLLTQAPLGDPTLGILDFTPFVTTVPNQFTNASSMGLSVIGFTFELAISLVDSYAPLSVGIAANLAGTSVVDQMSLTRQNGTSMVFFPDPSVVPGSGQPPSSYWFLPMNPAGGGGSDPEYCETTLSAGDPTGAGGIVFQVQSADCVPDGLLYCVDADCDSLAGQQLVLIDYGFLKTQADG